MGIATSLRKVGNLQPLATGIKNYINRKRKEESKRKLIELMGNFETGLSELSQGFKSEIDRSFDPNPNFQNRQAFDQGIGRIQNDFIEGLIPERENLGADNVNLALDNIESLIQANTPQQPAQNNIDFETFGNQVFRKDARGDINFDEPPAFNIPQKQTAPKSRLIDENGNERVYGYESPDGDRIINGKKYVVTRETDKRKEPGLPDPSVGIGRVNQGVKVLRDFTKKAKFTSEKDESGNDVITNVSVPGYEDMSFEDYNSLKEELKNDYLDDAVILAEQQGLNDDPETGAIAIIRKYKEQGATLDEALRKFKQENGDTIDATDIKVLRDYFTLLGF